MPSGLPEEERWIFPLGEIGCHFFSCQVAAEPGPHPSCRLVLL